MQPNQPKMQLKIKKKAKLELGLKKSTHPNFTVSTVLVPFYQTAFNLGNAISTYLRLSENSHFQTTLTLPASKENSSRGNGKNFRTLSLLQNTDCTKGKIQLQAISDHQFSMFENHLKMSHLNFSIFVQLKLTCLVTLLDRKLQIFKILQINIFLHFQLTFVHSKFKSSSLQSQC